MSPRPCLRPPAGAALLALVLLGIPALVMGFPDLLARLAPPLLYYPERLSERLSSPAAWGLAGAEERWIRTADGVRLHAWLVRARRPSARPTPPDPGAPARGAALFLHGNAGHLAHRAPIAAGLAELGLDALLVDYRGYGRSEGRPSEPGLLEDARAAHRELREASGAPPERILVIGNSLGGAVAAALAADVSPAGVVVTGGFRSVPRVAARLYPWLPSRMLEWTRNRFDAEAALARTGAPKLIACGALDRVIPCDETRALHASAAAPKRWLEVEGAGHGDLWASPDLWREVARFADDVLGGREGEAGR